MFESTIPGYGEQQSRAIQAVGVTVERAQYLDLEKLAAAAFAIY